MMPDKQLSDNYKRAEADKTGGADENAEAEKEIAEVEKRLSADIDRVEQCMSAESVGEKITMLLRTHDGVVSTEVTLGDVVEATIRTALSIPVDCSVYARLDGEALDGKATFDDNGISECAQISVIIELPPVERNTEHLIWASDNCNALLDDYFDSYDLDGCGTINSTEQLKQLCTNLVVKLDLDMDVADIDEMVQSAGGFVDDRPYGENNWDTHMFKAWFLSSISRYEDVVRVQQWMVGNTLDYAVREDDVDTNETGPFWQGIYTGTITSAGGSMYTNPRIFAPKDCRGNLQRALRFPLKCYIPLCRIEDSTQYSFSLHAKNKVLVRRQGMDCLGKFETKGGIEGNKIRIEIQYESVSGKPGPKLSLEGEWIETSREIVGTWQSDDPMDCLRTVGLACGVGTFHFKKFIDG